MTHLDATTAYSTAYRVKFVMGVDRAGPECGHDGPVTSRRRILHDRPFCIDAETGVGQVRQYVDLGQRAGPGAFLGTLQTLRHWKEICRSRLFGPNQLELAVPKHPKVMVASQRDFTAAARPQPEHGWRRPVAQEGSYWIFAGRSPRGIVGKRPIAAIRAGIAFGLCAIV